MNEKIVEFNEPDKLQVVSDGESISVLTGHTIYQSDRYVVNNLTLSFLTETIEPFSISPTTPILPIETRGRFFLELEFLGTFKCAVNPEGGLVNVDLFQNMTVMELFKIIEEKIDKRQ